MGTELDLSSSLALCGYRWRTFLRWRGLGSRESKVLFAGSSSQQTFSREILGVLKALFRDQELVIPDQLSELKEPMQFKQFLNSLYQKQWVVYAKRPFGSAEQVFRYLGRYSHRVAISNQRLIEVDDDQVSFAWRDYADGNRNIIMSLEIDEFIRRFLLHVLPNGFVRIRHYGLLASGQIQTKWVRCLTLLTGENKQSKQREKTWIERAIEWFGFHPLKCPHCGKRNAT